MNEERANRVAGAIVRCFFGYLGAKNSQLTRLIRLTTGQFHGLIQQLRQALFVIKIALHQKSHLISQRGRPHGVT